MYIRELFYQRRKPVVSLEIFPPKPTLPIESVYATLEGLKELRPSFISVTYGAGGSNSARTIEIADKVKNHYGIEVLAHLTCVGLTREQITATLDQLAACQVDNILALRGDPPQGETVFVQPENGYRYAAQLVKHIKENGRFCLAAAAYPEGHIECRDMARNIEYLKYKVDQGADFLISQLFFDNDSYYSFREQMERAGVQCPLSIGIMPVLNAAQIERITALCGAKIPAALQKLLDRYRDSAEDMEKAGIEYACEQIADLQKTRFEGIHIYTMNKVAQVQSILQNTGLLNES
ncbi:methylenetetrahydrofolate reductase [NAD(P)H] [Propionispora vibrioides]|jgi:methylenetetrahydrofolate reductase (NADPH)|uniref:Methylenetetrahydrofolate reductase n=1 Tax=Propionispora vibrioides TaxID=112903 RepID=A0A1H8Y4K7_9FIRM|nr:methylenetetrahydrofolate reductase [NAD(P)H] [Propionispora vibrioides]SEP47016.1 5,10-methylenetetrahydrofolate reductase (NAD(P)) [Propionispora vibrioides]